MASTAIRTEVIYRPARPHGYVVRGDATQVVYEGWVEAAAAAQRRGVRVPGYDPGQEAVREVLPEPECWLVRVDRLGAGGRVLPGSTHRFLSREEAEAAAAHWRQ